MKGRKFMRERVPFLIYRPNERGRISIDTRACVQLGPLAGCGVGRGQRVFDGLSTACAGRRR